MSNEIFKSEILFLALAFDFYGVLLTQKQREIFELHRMQDLSLSEVGDALSVSPQAVRDSYNRTVSAFLYYEEKLGLVSAFNKRKETCETVIQYLDGILYSGFDDEKLAHIKGLVSSLMC